MSETRLKIAAAQYPIDAFTRWDEYEAKLARWVDEAFTAQAQLLVFPEYGSMELVSLLGSAARADLTLQIEGMQAFLSAFLTIHREFARRYNVYILASSFPVREGVGYVNRAHFFSPTGRMQWQDKLMMTRFENERWHIGAGAELKVFRTAFGVCAINLCYDVEFPLIARAQVQSGADLILVPSCTDTLAGYHRVRVGCQGRALENQCIVVQSPTVGSATWSEAVDVNVGAAGIFGPPDRGFPDDGVMAIGTLDCATWLYANIDLTGVEAVRREGQVYNFRDWTKQPHNAANSVSTWSMD